MAKDFQFVGVREFREKVATYREPVVVMHTRGSVKVLGTWYPDGWVPPTEQPTKKKRDG